MADSKQIRPVTQDALDRAMATAVLGLCAPWIDPSAPGLRIVLEHSVRYLVVDNEAKELVLDKTGLMFAILDAGKRSEDFPYPNAATWLAEYGRPINHERNHIPSLLLKSHQFTLSRSLQKETFPEAERIAELTVRSKRFSLRHLTVALILRMPIFPIGAVPIGNVLPGLIAKIIENAETGENVAVWRAISEQRLDVLYPSQSPPPSPTSSPAPSPSTESRKRRDKPPPPSSPPPPPKSEALRTLTDRPANTDELNRKAFAGALAEHLRAARAVSDGCAFAIHLHGPWGSGKSSVLNFLKDDLTNPDPAKQTPPWLVVEFNAWQHQRRRPPWWSLVQALYAHQPAKALDGSMRRWWLMKWWRLRTDWIVPLTVAAIAIIGGTTIWFVSDVAAKLTSGAVTAGIALIVALIGGQRWLVFGSSAAAESYKQQAIDPNKRLVDLYQNYVASLGKRKPPNYLAHDPMPIAIFIDDLDRCDGTYVVELLEGIQTLMRDAPVAFVIAADRRWICTAFEQHYSSFAEPIGEPGRPLGYLFLDKLFQISAGLPALSAQQRSRYWDHLLDSGAPAPVAAASEQVDKLAAASGLVAKQAVIDSAPVEQQAALRAVAVEQSYAPEAQKQLEHRLRPFAALLEPNPRSMKRLVNAVAIARARCLLEGRAVALEPLARWTIIELRWPLVAAWLAEAPERIGKLVTARARAALAPPPAIAPVLTAPSFVASLGTMKAEDIQAIVD